MADTVFVNMVTLSDADWFNDINRLHYTIFLDPPDLEAVKELLGLTSGSGGSGGPGGPGAANVLIQDPEPSGIEEGGEWFESDTGRFYLRYQNPDDTFTWVGINSSGPKGDPGGPGPAGPAGPQGPVGLQGATSVACSDETTALTAGPAKVTFRMPYALTLTKIKASLTAASTSGIVTVDVNKNGVSLFSTVLTFDVNEKTTATAATPAVLATTALADDDEITVDIDVAGTGAKGLKVYLI